DLEGVVAADRDKGVELVAFPDREGAQDVVGRLVEIRPRGAQDGAALVDDLADVLHVEVDLVVVAEAGPAVHEADALPFRGPVMGEAGDDAPDDGVEAGGVAAAGEDAHFLHGAKCSLERKTAPILPKSRVERNELFQAAPAEQPE